MRKLDVVIVVPEVPRRLNVDVAAVAAVARLVPAH